MDAQRAGMVRHPMYIHACSWYIMYMSCLMGEYIYIYIRYITYICTFVLATSYLLPVRHTHKAVETSSSSSSHDAVKWQAVLTKMLPLKQKYLLPED